MIYFSEGGKGGVGKSVTCGLKISSLLEDKKDVVLIETDTSNPDVFGAYQNECTGILQEIDSESGWAQFLTLMQKHKDKDIVINCGARNQKTISNFGKTIELISEREKIDYKVMWTINTDIDSLLLLDEYRKTIPLSKICLVKNGRWGSEGEFDVYNKSKIKNEIENEIYLPKFLKNVAKTFASKRIPFHKMAENLDFGSALMWESEYPRLMEIVREI